MENAEQHGTQDNAKTEQLDANIEGKDLMGQMQSLKSTNERLLAQSKDNADKYRKLRDATDSKEKLELEESENWKLLLDKEKDERHKLSEDYNTLKKSSLKKDLNFNIVKLIGSTQLNTGVTVEHVIDEVLRTGMVEVSDDESEFVNINDAFEKVKNDAVFLFNSQKAPMANAIPGGRAPAEKKLTNTELLNAAILQIAKK